MDFKNKTKDFFRKYFYFKIDKEIKNSLKEVLFYATIPGLLINYSLWGTFGVPFHWYSFSAFGIFLYLIKVEFMNIWANLWFKQPIQ